MEQFLRAVIGMAAFSLPSMLPVFFFGWLLARLILKPKPSWKATLPAFFLAWIGTAALAVPSLNPLAEEPMWALYVMQFITTYFALFFLSGRVRRETV